MAYSMFPRKTEPLVDALNSMVDSNVIRRNIAAVRWWVIYYYLQGYRNISIYSWENAVVNVSFEDAQGELQFTYEQIVNQYRTEVGRFMRVNTEPVAERGNVQGLDSVRKAGAAHAVLSYMDGRSTVHTRQRELARVAEMVCAYGTGALHHYRDTQREDIGMRTRREVVPAWELMPVGGDSFSLGEVRGDMRHRWVPLEWAQEQEHLKEAFTAEGATDAALGVQEYAYGTTPMTGGPAADTTYRPGFGGAAFGVWRRSDADEQKRSRVSKSYKDKEADSGGVKWIELSEIWERPDSEYVNRYLAFAGDIIGADYDYDELVVCPLAVFRYITTGSYYGRSFVDINLALNYEIEKMLANMMQNVTDFDIHGVTVIPTTAGISAREFQTPERRKVIFAEPDQVVPNFQPFRIDPANSGEAPLRTIGAIVELADKVASQTSLLSGQAPGRVDSAAGLGFVLEAGNVGIIPTTNSIADAYVQVYASMLQAAKDEIEEGDATIPIPALDSRMLGVTLDIQQGTSDLTNNPIPDPWDVRLDIKERVGKSPEQAKQEAGMMLEAGILDPVEFRILNEKDGLGFPVVYRTYYEQWRRAVLTKLIVYNDGVTPGQVPAGVDYENPDIVLEVLDELIQSVEFLVASEEVRNAFFDLRADYMKQMGNLPDALPSLTQLAEPDQVGGAGGAGGGQLPAMAG